MSKSKSQKAREAAQLSSVGEGVTPGSTEPEVKNPVKSLSNGVAVFREGMHPRTLRQNSVK